MSSDSHVTSHDFAERRFPTIQVLSSTRSNASAFGTWLQLWNEAQTLEQALGLLHVALSDWRSLDPEAVRWMIALAGWNRRSGYHSHNGWSCNSQACSHSRLSAKALEVVVQEVLRKDDSDQTPIWVSLVIRSPEIFSDLLMFALVCKNSRHDFSKEKGVVIRNAVLRFLETVADGSEGQVLRREYRDQIDEHCKTHIVLLIKALVVWRLDRLILWTDQDATEALYDLVMIGQGHDKPFAHLNEALTSETWRAVPARLYVALSATARAEEESIQQKRREELIKNWRRAKQRLDCLESQGDKIAPATVREAREALGARLAEALEAGITELGDDSVT